MNGKCGFGFSCQNDYCCLDSIPRCINGIQSLGACFSGGCGTGAYCTAGNLCCPNVISGNFRLLHKNSIFPENLNFLDF